MNTRLPRRAAAALVAAAAFAVPLHAQQAQKQPLASVPEALATSAILAGRGGPASVNWVEGGKRFTYTEQNPVSNREEVHRLDPNTLQDQLLFDNRVLTMPGEAEPIKYRSFQWAADSRHVVFQANFRPIYRRSGLSDFYVYDLADRSLQLAVRDARTAELAPDGAMLGFERGGDMYVYDMAAEQERRLTTDATDSVFNGVHDWVYEEEFGEAQAWKWSPDSRYIAYWQTDERGVPFVQLTNYAGHHPDWVRINYPKVGDHNPQVRIGVVDARTGERRWLDTGLSGDFYIPRIYWTSQPEHPRGRHAQPAAEPGAPLLLRRDTPARGAWSWRRPARHLDRRLRLLRRHQRLLHLPRGACASSSGSPTATATSTSTATTTAAS